MVKAYQIFSELEEQGIKALEALKKIAYAPDMKKPIRTWGITEVCNMIGRSKQSIRDLEKAGKLPAPSIDANTGRRCYTLRQINKIREILSIRPQKPNDADPAIIAIANFKGGVTKTTEAIHIAQGEALKGYRTLLIDQDSQGSATGCMDIIPDLDIKPDQTFLSFIRGKIDTIEPLIRKTYWDGLDILPANLSLYNAEFELPVKQHEASREGKNFLFFDLLSKGIETIKHKYDIIIIDCPPSMGMLSINAVYAANGIVIPVPPLMLDVASTIQFFSMMKDVMDYFPDKEYNFVRLIITKFDSSENAELLVTLMRQAFGSFMALAQIPASEAIKKASTSMQSIYDIDNYPGSKKTLDRIRTATDELIDEIEKLIKKSWHQTLGENKHDENKIITLSSSNN